MKQSGLLAAAVHDDHATRRRQSSDGRQFTVTQEAQTPNAPAPNPGPVPGSSTRTFRAVSAASLSTVTFAVISVGLTSRS